MDNRKHIYNAAGLALLTLTLSACSWADFKDFGYQVAKDYDCRERQGSAPPGQRVRGVPDCFPPGDPRGMTPEEYRAERNRILGIKEPEDDREQIAGFGTDESGEQQAAAGETDRETN